jgi:putative addiction module component (TIGR02574 family)
MIERLRELPIEERIRLVQELWDSIAQDREELSVSEEQKALLDRRLDAYEADGIKGRKAEDVIADIRNRL